MRTILEYGGKSLPVMGCSFKAEIHPPAPRIGTKEYAEWRKKIAEDIECKITLQIAFPAYYWRAQYYQRGQPLFICDFPFIGNGIHLKDCKFVNRVELRLPDGTTIKGSPCDDMEAEAIRKNTAILEQEGLAINGHSELLAEIAKLNAEVRRIHDEHLKTILGAIERVERQGADIAEEARRLKQGKRQAEEKPMDVAREVVEMLVAGLDSPQRGLFFAMKNADGNQTHAAQELGVAQSTVNKALPALRDAIKANGRELPEFLLPPTERKRLPDAPRKMAFGAGGVEAADTRTPFDEVAEKDERGGGAE